MAAACDEDIWREGNALVTISEAPKALVEELCRRMSNPPDLRVDWHYCGGRPIILYIGSLDLARAALEKQLEWFNSECDRHFKERHPDWPSYYGPVLKMEQVTRSRTAKSIGQLLNS
jgi:hypothetical protein